MSANQDNYTPLNKVFLDKKTEWTFANLTSLTYEEISKQRIVMWCHENLEGRWTMLGGNKFGFEDAGDAMQFKIQFGFST